MERADRESDWIDIVNEGRICRICSDARRMLPSQVPGQDAPVALTYASGQYDQSEPRRERDLMICAVLSEFLAVLPICGCLLSSVVGTVSTSRGGRSSPLVSWWIWLAMGTAPSLGAMALGLYVTWNPRTSLRVARHGGSGFTVGLLELAVVCLVVLGRWML